MDPVGGWGVNGRVYRMVAGDVFCGKFSSDRRHMRREEGGWVAPPPKWEVIRNGGVSRVVDDVC
jgi:hypothetical protein